MATWPSELSEWNLAVSIQRQSGVLRTEMDAGPAKLRRRYSATTTNFSTSKMITGAQRDVLESFYDNNQSLRFDHTDPTTDSTQEFRFLSAPTYELIAGAPDPDDRVYRVQLILEKMP